MKLLLDTCVWGKSKAELQQAGHDVIWCGDWEKDPGDEEILDYAFREGRILVTLDKDFGELAILSGRPHSGIVRLVSISAKRQAQVCLQALDAHGNDLLLGAVDTVEPGRLRFRPPESGNEEISSLEDSDANENTGELPAEPPEDA